MTTAPRSKKPELLKVRRMHRRDLNKAWEFLKLVFRGVNKNTVEYQRPRTKGRFMEVYDAEGVEQLVFEVGSAIVGYAECSYTTGGSDSWMNPRYFDKRGMRPMFVDELASHPDYQGRGVGSFMLEQLQHIARAHGCTHLVLEVAQNNKHALTWYHKRNFYRLDAAIFLAQRVPTEPELLPARPLTPGRKGDDDGTGGRPETLVAEVPPTKAAPKKTRAASPKRAAKTAAGGEPTARPATEPASPRPARARARAR